MPELFITFETDADLEAALEALAEAEADGYIEGAFNTVRTDKIKSFDADDDTAPKHWD